VLAIFLILSVIWSCCHSAHLGQFQASAWTVIIIITQRFYRQLIASLKVIANFFDMSNLMKDDIVSGATDNVEK